MLRSVHLAAGWCERSRLTVHVGEQSLSTDLNIGLIRTVFAISSIATTVPGLRYFLTKSVLHYQMVPRAIAGPLLTAVVAAFNVSHDVFSLMFQLLLPVGAYTPRPQEHLLLYLEAIHYT